MPKSSPILLEINNLQVKYSSKIAVKDATFSIEEGERIAIVGESGSGKSTIVNAILGVLPETATTSGEISYTGKRLGYVGQDPNTNLNPVLKIGTQVADVLNVKNDRSDIKRLETDMADKNRRSNVKYNGIEVVDLLESARLRNAKNLCEKYPHELSGGMKQRTLISLGMALNPELLVADEPTSALDASIAGELLDFLEDEVQKKKTALLFVTHDLSLAANHSDKLIVMKNGEIVESGPTLEITKSPKNAYTKGLLLASQCNYKVNSSDNLNNKQEAYRIKNLTKVFATKSGNTTAVNNVSFSLLTGLTTAIVGESGSGKSTLVNILLGLETPTSGSIYFEGENLTKLLKGKGKDKILRDNYIHRISAVFQNPYSSLNPTDTVGRIIEEPMLIHKQRLTEFRSREVRNHRIGEVLKQVGLVDMLNRHPASLSGGQRQRVAIARSLVLRPDVIFFDEAVSALDVLVSTQIVDLLNDIQRQMNLTAVFITHDMNVAKRIADHVLVMHNGKIIEQGAPREVLKER